MYANIIYSDNISECEVFEKHLYKILHVNSTLLSSQVIGGYAEIHLHASTTLPPSHTEDRVQYSVLDVALLSATSTTSPPPVSSGERSQQSFEEEEPINETNVHPLGKLYSVFSHTKHSFKHSCISTLLPYIHNADFDYLCIIDKMINGYLILLQLVPVQPCWRSFGSAAGLDEETLDNVSIN